LNTVSFVTTYLAKLNAVRASALTLSETRIAENDEFLKTEEHIFSVAGTLRKQPDVQRSNTIKPGMCTKKLCKLFPSQYMSHISVSLTPRTEPEVPRLSMPDATQIDENIATRPIPVRRKVVWFRTMLCFNSFSR
jgi:hypothetical protein